MIKKLALFVAAFAAIRVEALKRDLNIVNTNLAPDGFTRS
jgi:hypothetical protein